MQMEVRKEVSSVNQWWCCRSSSWSSVVGCLPAGWVIVGILGGRVLLSKAAAGPCLHIHMHTYVLSI